MSKAIIKYSRLIENDGGFNTLRKDLEDLQKDSESRGLEIRKGFKIIDPNDSTEIAKIQKEISELRMSFKELDETKKILTKTEENYLKTQKLQSRTTTKTTKSLEELEKQLASYKLDLKQLNTQEKKNQVSQTDSIKQRAELKIRIKETSQALAAEQKEILNANKLTKKQKDLIEALNVVENKRVSTIDEIHQRMKALRIVIKNTSIDTEEGKERIKQFNEEINSLSDIVSENSDKFIQNKIIIGNYKESVKEALTEVDFFKTGLGGVDDKLNSVLKLLTLNKEELNDMEDSLKNNGSAVKRFAVGFGKLNGVLKASIIGTVLILLGSIASVFKQGRSGAIKFRKAMALLSVQAKVLINTFADFGKGLFKFLSTIKEEINLMALGFKVIGLKAKEFFNSFKFGKSAREELAGIREEIKKTNKEIEENTLSKQKKAKDGYDQMALSVGNFSKRMEDAKNATAVTFDGIIRGFEISDEINKSRNQLVLLQGQLVELESKADDSTQGLLSQLSAARLAIVKGQEVFVKEEQIARLQLELTNAKARADLEAARTSIGASAERVLAIKDEVEFAKALLDLNQELGVEQNPLDDDSLQEQQEALRELLQTEQDFNAFKLDAAKKEREVKRA